MYRDGLVYQESRMASEEEFLEDLAQVELHSKKSEWKGGPVLFRDGNRIYTDAGESHTLVVGDTGSTKTIRFVLPLIYSCARARESMIIVDPKGELARRTASLLKGMGYQTEVINLRTPQDSPSSWNPLGIVQKSYAEGEEGRQRAILQLNDLLNTLFYTRSKADKDRYWNETAGQLALGIFELLEHLGVDITIKNLLIWRYKMLPDGTLQNIYKNLPQDSDICQNLAGYMSLTADNTKSCILSTFDQLVRVFKSSPALTELLSESSFDMNRIGEEKTAVFLVVPDEKTTFHFLATLFISQCYEALLDNAERHGGTLPRRVNFILEEFCNMPVLNDLVPMLTAARSRNIRFHLVIQSYEQMVDKYGEHISRTVLDNCGNLIYLHSREMAFLNYISQLAGVNEYGRQLLPTSRLQRLKKNETLIFHDRCYPFLAQDIPLIFEYQLNLGTEIPVKQKERVRHPNGAARWKDCAGWKT